MKERERERGGEVERGGGTSSDVLSASERSEGGRREEKEGDGM